MKLFVATVVTTILTSGWWLAVTLVDYPNFAGVVGFFSFIGTVVWLWLVIYKIVSQWDKVD